VQLPGRSVSRSYSRLPLQAKVTLVWEATGWTRKDSMLENGFIVPVRGSLVSIGGISLSGQQQFFVRVDDY
jgi:hypothetical protein